MDAAAPAFLPRWLRPALRPGALWTLRHLQRKYQTRAEESTSHLGHLRAALDKLRAGLASGKSHLLGHFTYADIVMATLVQAVLPVADRFWRLAPPIRAVWTEPDLVDEYADLVAWRDTIYERHRARV
jgi:glutathione S-transferase